MKNLMFSNIDSPLEASPTINLWLENKFLVGFSASQAV